MVMLLLFGNISEDPKFKLFNKRYFEKNISQDQFDTTMIFNLALSLFQIGSELETGSLKEVDLKALSIIATLKDDHLLVLGLSNSKSGQKRKLELKGALDEIHRIFLQNSNKPYKEIIEILLTRFQILKKEISRLDEWV